MTAIEHPMTAAIAEGIRPFGELARSDVAFAGGVRAGIDAISVNLDVVARTRRLIDQAERRLLLDAARLETTRAVRADR